MFSTILHKINAQQITLSAFQSQTNSLSKHFAEIYFVSATERCFQF